MFDVCARTHFIISSSLAAPWTIDHEGPVSVGFSRQEYWSGLPFLPLGDFPDLGIKSTSLVSPALAGGFFTTEPPAKLCVFDSTKIDHVFLVQERKK